MKLNHECIRDLLLYIEENLNYDDSLEINELQLKDYSSEELLYTAQKLSEAGYLNCDGSYGAEDVYFVIVDSISYQGHQFLDTIRDNQVWNKTKNILSVLKSVSVEVISETASKVVNNIIDKNIS